MKSKPAVPTGERLPAAVQNAYTAKQQIDIVCTVKTVFCEHRIQPWGQGLTRLYFSEINAQEKQVPQVG